ncbi:hypothetical protein [Streptomyces echinatus]|uniref:Uncharacterized protein n=1 Tax=Streptomyces echinatus TaxID=67293 RepID=A0A7W9UP60_9ACTN|nr:hypothetical protein [Streptomyces echinatus]MBB5925139.1 hypothetical protein [Streptomyces echinatus]
MLRTYASPAARTASQGPNPATTLAPGVLSQDADAPMWLQVGRLLSRVDRSIDRAVRTDLIDNSPVLTRLGS